MKKILLTLLLFSLFLCLPSSLKAHGGPPYIKINGAADETNLAAASSPFFKIPYEVAAAPIVVKEITTFEIDTSLVPFSLDRLGPDDLIWEFGDGSSATGVKVTHSYQKIGSFIVNLKARDTESSNIVDLENVQVNVITSKNSQIPKAVIKVNGKTITDPFKEPVQISKDSITSLDGTPSEGDIKNYKWDFGDGTPLTTGAKQTHKFNFSQGNATVYFPVLRVEDNNGFFSDAVIQIIAPVESSDTNNAGQATQSASQISFLPFGIASIVIVLIGGFILFRIIKKK